VARAPPQPPRPRHASTKPPRGAYRVEGLTFPGAVS
jgi:hypothetical protein